MVVFPAISPPLIMAKKPLYRIRNWREYNAALVSRGSLTVWLSDDAQRGWLYTGAQQQGHPIVFSDAAMETALTVRAVYHLTLRQTEGFLRSVFALMRSTLPVPDYTTVSKRSGALSIDLPIQGSSGPIHVVIDSSGMKIHGEGEWKVKIHGTSKRRTWRKCHIGVDPETGEIRAEALTEAHADDAAQVEGLLAQIDGEIDLAAMDGAYDQHALHALFVQRGARALIPPSKDAKIRKHGNATGPPLPRDEILRAIRRTSRARWKRESGYHMRSLVENAFFRTKTIFGSSLRSRRFEHQETEARIRCAALNVMTHLGMPESVRVG